MNAQHVGVAIVGGGQAGLSLSWHLKRRGIEHVVFERDSIAHEWRDGRWDAFTLVTPNWQCRLPGFAYDLGDDDGFMRRDAIHDFVTRYAASFDPPVHEGVAVNRVAPLADGGYAVATTEGDYTADAVVIATGGYHRPVVPDFAPRLPDRVTQLHSSVYRSPGELPDGAVLVVGSGQSGAQIAEDLHLAGRRVHLALGMAPRSARFYRGRDCIAWLEDAGVYDRPVGEQAGGLAKRESTNHYMTGRDGGRDIDLRRFALEGMQLWGRAVRVDGSTIRFTPTVEASLDHADSVMESIKNDIDRYIDANGIDAPTEARYAPVWRPEAEREELDLDAAGITSIIWSIGYRADYSYIDVGVFDGRGHATHHRGVTAARGLYFLGLPWLHTWGSGRFASIARDAEHLADAIESESVLTSAPAASSGARS
jgi:flavin-dependent oxidoreductase